MAFYNEFPGNRFYDGDLAWLMKRVKELMDQGQTLEASIKALQDELDNLDLDAAVKRQLKKMLDDGALDAYINPYMLRGKKCLFFGDSIVWGDSADASHSRVATPFPAYIAQHSGCTSINAGRKSATMAFQQDSDNNFANQLAQHTSDVAEADYIFILFGINDYSAPIPIGSPDSTDPETFFGAMKSNLDTIRMLSGAQVIFISIPPCGAYWTGTGNSRYQNIRTYVEAVKRFCSDHGLRYIDALNHSGMDATNWERYSADRVHLTQAGYNLLGQCVLDNLGGNSTAPESGDNVWQRMALPNFEALGHYRLIASGTQRTNGSYTDWHFQPGLYRFRLKYSCSLSDNVRVGVTVKCGDGYLGSPIGITADGGVHELIWYHNSPSLKEGAFGLFPVVPEDVTITEFDVFDLEVRPITGRVSVDNVLELTAAIGTGSIFVTRHDDGSITVRGRVTEATASAFATIVSNAALRPLYYTNGSQDTFYFAAATGNTAFARGQIAGPILSIAQAVDNGSISFDVTY